MILHKEIRIFKLFFVKVQSEYFWVEIEDTKKPTE